MIRQSQTETQPAERAAPARPFRSKGEIVPADSDAYEGERQVVEKIHESRGRIERELAKVIVGQKEATHQLLISLFAGGHCLITGAPGLAKTLLVRTIAQVFHLKFRRIQFTPDLMPADITGTEILEEAGDGHRRMQFVKGPIFANVILADEINRTPPKTQAALLEAMQEHQVTAAGVRYPLEEPFFVLATQNPIEMEGTYPLPEAQLDRFMFNVIVDYLPEDDEVAVVQQTTSRKNEPIEPLFDGSDVLAFHDVVRKGPDRRGPRAACRAARCREPPGPGRARVREKLGELGRRPPRGAVARSRCEGPGLAGGKVPRHARRPPRAHPPHAPPPHPPRLPRRGGRPFRGRRDRPPHRACEGATPLIPSPDRVRIPGPDSRRDDPARSGAALIDPTTLMRIKSLQMRAKVAVEGFVKGIHRSPYHGFSVEFSEYREYSPGDDPRYLDWRLFAGRTVLRQAVRRRDEPPLHARSRHEPVDGLHLGHLHQDRLRRAAAATIAYFLTTQRDAVGLITFEDRITDYLPPRHRPGHLRRLMAALERPPEGRATDLAAPLEQIAATVRKRGLIILISDLLASTDLLRTRLGYLRSRGHDVVVLRVLDPAELTFSFTTPAMYRDLESGREVYIDPDSARSEYLKRFSSHAAAV